MIIVFFTHSIGETRQRSKFTALTEDHPHTDTLTEISESMTMTFNDLVFLTSSLSIDSDPHIPQAKPESLDDQNELTREVDLNDDPSKPHENNQNEDLLKKAEGRFDVQDKGRMNKTPSTQIVRKDRWENSDPGDGEIGSGNIDLELGVLENGNGGLTSSVLENGNGELGPGVAETSVDDNTFTVSSNTTLVQDSLPGSRETTLRSLDTTLNGRCVAQEMTSNGHNKQLSETQPTNAIRSSAEVVSTSDIVPGNGGELEGNWRENGKDQVEQKDLITATVRSEMKDILQLQHQQLLTLLKTVEAKSGKTVVPSVDCSTQMGVESTSHGVNTKSQNKLQKSHDSVQRSHDVHIKSPDCHSQSQDLLEHSSATMMPVSH